MALQQHTDNITGFLREVAARVAHADDRAEVDDILRRASDSIRERINEERIEAAGRLAGWLAHKINNPLGAISGNAQLLGRRLQRDMGDGEALDSYLRYVDSVQAQVERCAEITSEILSFTRPRELDVRCVDVGEIIEEAVELAKFGRPRAEISVSCEELPRVQSDRDMLVKVFYEVIANAVAEGGVEVKADQHPEGWVRVIVSDDGPGIPEDALQRIFDPFFSTKEKAKGLGLTSALGIIGQLGGTIEVTETRPGGTVFTIEIPVERR